MLRNPQELPREVSSVEFGAGNMYDYGARLYDPSIGRFTGIDPLAELYPAHNAYVYVLNNPLALTDPSGMTPTAYGTTELEDQPWYSLAKHGGSISLQPYDWYEDANGNIRYNAKIKSQADLDAAGIQGTYLGETFIDFAGSTNESLGADGTLTGEGANPAQVTVYGPSGADDIQTYDGLSISSDPSKYSMIEEGFYNAEYSPMATSLYGDNARTKSKGIPGALTYAVSQNGSTDLSPVGGVNINKGSKNFGTGVINGVFLHRTNWSGFAGMGKRSGKGVSEGCLLICGTQWRRFEGQVGKSTNIGIRLTR